MKHSKALILLILVLIAGSAWTVWKVPTQEGLDLVGGVRGVFLATSQSGSGPVSQNEMQTAIQVIMTRVNKLGVSETQVQQKGSDQLVVELPLSGALKTQHMTADQALTQLMNVVQPAVLKFIEIPETITVNLLPRNAQGEETFSFTGPDGKPITEQQALAASTTILTGKDLVAGGAHGEYSPQGQGYEVTLQFDSKGADIFANYTESHVGKKFAITLDNKVLTDPVIRSPIPDGNGVIEGGFNSLEEAEHLAILLNAGALPVNLTPVDTSLIEATLGAAAVHQSIWAGIAGLCVVVLFMIAYYRLPGILASAALLIYSLFIFAIFKAIPVTLTLPGIAGAILSIGMAVDANILIFERLKEEIRAGRTLRAAIDAGFSRAFTAIFDSNACTFITCGVLGFYGTGPVKGFAVTLAIGVVVSLFTAVTVTRTFLHLLDNTGALQHPEWFGINVQWMGKWAQGRDIIGRRKFYYALSLAVIVPGLIFIGLGQLRRGVDFTGGNEWIVQSAHGVTETDMTNALKQAGLARDEYDLQIGRSLPRPGEIAVDLATVHSKPGVIGKDTQKDALDFLHKDGIPDAITVSNETISPIIGTELELNALMAVLIASVLIVLYLTVRFAGQEGFKNGLKYGVCAVIAMLHDVFVVVGLFAIFGYIFQVEIDMNFLTAVLTIIGFSVHDTIVIFDRVRENLRLRSRDESFETTYNKSIVQTFARSINTSFTVLLVLLSLLFFGATVIRWFSIALLVGIISGTYSSIFNASPLVVDWEHVKRKKELERKALVAQTKAAARITVKKEDQALKPRKPKPALGESGSSQPAIPAVPTSPLGASNGAPAGSTAEAGLEAGEQAAPAVASEWTPTPESSARPTTARATPRTGPSKAAPKRKQRY